MFQKYTDDFYKFPIFHEHTPVISSTAFPFILYMVGSFGANENFCLESEGYDHYFFGLTLAGKGQIRYDDRECPLDPDKAFLVDRTDYFRICTSSENKLELKWFTFSGTACKHYFDLINKDIFEPVQLTNATEVSQLIDDLHMLAQFTNTPTTDPEISMVITKTLTCVIKSMYNEMNFAEDKSDVMNKALKYILSNYSNNIKIKDICTAAFTSKSHLINLFKTYLQTTPHKYITKLRINKAKALLTETNMPVSEIAYLSGYENTGLFIENFRKNTSTTPHKYRSSVKSMLL